MISEIELAETRALNILMEELKKANVNHDYLRARIISDVRTVGVQGDQRTYAHPLEIEVTYKEEPVLDESFLRAIGNRIPNEIPEINRVTYTLAKKP